jgi:hypothetical protein
MAGLINGGRRSSAPHSQRLGKIAVLRVLVLIIECHPSLAQENIVPALPEGRGRLRTREATGGSGFEWVSGPHDVRVP